MFDRVRLENTCFSPRSLNMNSIIIDSMQQRKFEVHTPFRFEAVDPSTKLHENGPLTLHHLQYVEVINRHINTPNVLKGLTHVRDPSPICFSKGEPGGETVD